MDFDLFELLSADHRRLGDLVSEPGSELVLVRELSMHLAAETKLLYPAVEHHLARGHEIAATLRHADHQLEALLATVEAEGPDTKRGDELRTMVQRHVDAQEQIFPATKAAIPPDELARLGQEVSRTIREAPTHPHPHLPDHGFFEPVADAIASTIDHLRDGGHDDDQ
jgi:hypothetical protein